MNTSVYFTDSLNENIKVGLKGIVALNGAQLIIKNIAEFYNAEVQALPPTQSSLGSWHFKAKDISIIATAKRSEHSEKNQINLDIVLPQNTSIDFTWELLKLAFNVSNGQTD